MLATIVDPGISERPYEEAGANSRWCHLSYIRGHWCSMWVQTRHDVPMRILPMHWLRTGIESNIRVYHQIKPRPGKSSMVQHRRSNPPSKTMCVISATCGS